MNQVSLGAGEIIATNNEFETWLWKTARVFVKQRHSDNGVIVVESFTNSCKGEG